MPAAAKYQLRPDPFLKAIALFDARFRTALGDWRRLDRVRGFGGPDNPYDDFAPELERLFGRTRQAFDQGSMRLARDAYAALFATLALKDVYGSALRLRGPSRFRFLASRPAIFAPRARPPIPGIAALS